MNAQTTAAVTPGARIAVGDLVIDRERYLVTIGERVADLTYMEFEALYLIASEDGRVASYEALAAGLWEDAGDDHRRRLAVLISRIRSKLGHGADYLQTVRQVGYRLLAHE
ncbi:MAG: winged helix-turn-helix domain-containing protein [Chloroflexi bacterium]|nr:winged helix-turn-helix domain-containing protein [Chloroflexota bacterium]